MSFAPKKYFGQHFLKEKSIAQRIALSLKGHGNLFSKVLEIGPGPGALTVFLHELFGTDLYLVEIDQDMIYVLERGKIIEAGRHLELLDQKGLYYAMWRQQIGERTLEAVA